MTPPAKDGLLVARLRAQLARWRSSLPSTWRTQLGGIDLDFDAVGPKLTLAAADQIWPHQGQGPTGAHVFKAFHDLPPAKVRVVIFGNDPYTKITQATGRSFEQGDLGDWASDFAAARRVSPSLKSILCAAAALDRRQPGRLLTAPSLKSHSQLRDLVAAGKVRFPKPPALFPAWASQGVLWLNTTLTFSKWDHNHRQAHHLLWQPFTCRVLEILARRPGVVFALWGGEARKLKPVIRSLAGDAEPVFCETGHPQKPENYFKDGNPLAAISASLSGRPIRWL